MRVAFGTFGRAVGILVIAGAAVGYGIIPLWAGMIIVILGPIGGYFRACYVARRRDADAAERMASAITEGIRRARDAEPETRVPAPPRDAQASADRLMSRLIGP